MKIIIRIIVLIVIIGCSEDSDQTSNFNVDSISPLLGRIGDKITVSGNNVNKLNSIYFKNNHPSSFEFTKNALPRITPESTPEKQFFIVPEVQSEKTIIGKGAITGSSGDKYNFEYDFDLVGFFPINNNFSNFKELQVLDNNTAFLISNSQIYKSANGYYNWSKTTDIIDEEITKFYFLNENDGWIVTYADGYQNFYSTTDGGNNLILKFSISTLELNNTIFNLELSTPDFGFFSTGENTFIIDGNGYINVYEYYPSLNDLSFGKVELGDATFRNQNLMYLIPNGFPYALIKIENSIASYYDDFEMKKPLLPYFFGDTGYLQTATRDIFKTVNNGQSWTRIKSFEKCMYKIHFFDENIGLAFFCAPDQEIYRTIDGGITWDKYFTTTLNKHHSTIKNASKNYPYLTTLEGKLWKYIDE